MEDVTVLRGGMACPGVRSERVAAYEFDIPDRQWVRPGASRRQRAFLLLDESIQLDQPVILAEKLAGWWYVDLVEIREQATTIHVDDHFADVLVGPPGHPYRLLDLDELGEAMTDGVLTAAQVAHVLAATQAFLDRHLQGKGWTGTGWPDFPPAALSPVLDAPIRGSV